LRVAVLGDRNLGGRALCRALSEATDRWLSGLFATAVEGARGRYALVATGGYGRGELAPFSDLDVLLLHDSPKHVASVAERIWYPVWDAASGPDRVKLGHAVRTVKEAKQLASSDLDTATALLTARHLAGDAELTAELVSAAQSDWRARRSRWLSSLAAGVVERHEKAGEAAFLLEPNLKESSGGLRDVHALRWAEAGGALLSPADRTALSEAEDVLLDIRVALHRVTGRPGDILALQEQDAVAESAGYASADALMAGLSEAARKVTWIGDETWTRLSGRQPQGGDHVLASGVLLRGGEVELEAAVDPSTDPVLVLRVARTAAAAGARISRATLERLAASAPEMPSPWPVGAIDDFVGLLLTGHSAIPVFEALDQYQLLARVLPEWAPVRYKPQRNAYHRFTVDHHLLVAASNAAGVADRVERPDLLVVGTLLHDIGKGHPGDHTVVGIELVGEMAPRMGFDAHDTEVLQTMVAEHLLLPDIATRRDLSDDGTIRYVADRVGSLEVLHLLDGLTFADSTATGPAAWGSWKEELVGVLVDRVSHVLAGGEVADAIDGGFPTAHQRDLLAQRRRIIETSDDMLVVVSPDRPGLFSRVAGVLSLSGLTVLEAAAYSNDEGMALEQFRVRSGFGDQIPWERVVRDLERALDGRLALEARLAERSKAYRRARRLPGLVTHAEVLVDNALSDDATVIEVRAPDGVGVLWRITRALHDLDLDIRSAKIQTIDTDAVDSFYVRDAQCRKVTDHEHLAEVERALLHSLGRSGES